MPCCPCSPVPIGVVIALVFVVWVRLYNRSGSKLLFDKPVLIRGRLFRLGERLMGLERKSLLGLMCSALGTVKFLFNS